MKSVLATFFLVAACYGAPPSGRVIGGDEVKGQRYPYLVSIQTGLFGEHLCGGAIISPKWVVTAAHCAGLSLIVSRVVAGTFDLTDVDNNTAVQIRYIDLYSVVKHPDFSDLNNDIALLKMTEPFEFNEFVDALPISRVPCVAANEINVFSGWGTQNGTGIASLLETANMTVLSFKECQQIIYDAYADNLQIKEDIHICITGTAAPCIMDGGSPLVQDNRLIGLLTWLPTTCADKKIPAIFTNTGYYKEFIKQYVDDLP